MEAKDLLSATFTSVRQTRILVYDDDSTRFSSSIERPLERIPIATLSITKKSASGERGRR